LNLTNEISELAVPRNNLFCRVASTKTKRWKGTTKVAIHFWWIVPRSFYYLFPQKWLPEAPKVGQRVRIEGQLEIYLVLRLDTKRFSADLMLMTGNHQIEHNVPYFAIQPVTQEFRKGAGLENEQKGEATTA
jgi:hypothetical protein